MYDQPLENPRGLRVVKTGRSAKAINRAAKQGFWPHIRRIEPSKDLLHYFTLFRHRKSGEIMVGCDLRWPPDPAEYESVDDFEAHYPHTSELPFAAYLLPPDLAIGERVWLDDLIEDVVAVWTNQGPNVRLRWAEATWNGQGFEIHFDPEKDAPRWIG